MAMRGHTWGSKSVKELQAYLKARGVVTSNHLKAGLVELCERAEDLGIEIDPDGLVEDKEDYIISSIYHMNLIIYTWPLL